MASDDAGRCVKCGLCLAECPTYRLTGNEACSPRGRVVLVQGLESGEVAATAHGRELLDGCLLCRRCERVCPSGVPFGRIMDEGRALTRHFRSWRERAAVALITRPSLMAVAVRSVEPLRRLLPSRSLVSRLLRRRSRQRLPVQGIHPARGTRRGRVGLFTGCTGYLLDEAALHGAILLLTHAGYQVHVPAEQVCCGALDAHGGNAERARGLQQRNLEVFAGKGSLDAVVSVASGCGAHLAGYPGELEHEDISAFLLRSGALERLEFRPLPQQALLHTPCTLENVLRGGAAVEALLAAVPGLRVAPLGAPGGCCGAGGLGFLANPGLSRQLRAPLVEQIRREKPDLVITSNAGCGLHLEQGAEQPEYLHPVALLARQLVRD